ncbi:uncharacterized protein LOC143290080 [Babylonia areolata]|uniref:uncharacterized protein LOC143290080 n=1 Tax=Babylonia areolata TaxID=304850 RepID=UPI003FD25AFD
MAHLLQLSRLVGNLLCPECHNSGVSVSVSETERAGYASKLVLKCEECGYQNAEMSSPRLQVDNKQNVAFEINRRMTVLSHEVGGSHAVLQAFSTVTGVPGMHLKTFQNHDKKVTDAEISSGADCLLRSAAAIRNAYAETDADLREALDRGEEPIINISVSFDGTWQKRGFTSLFGVGVCIDILTGLVVDFCVLSKYCHACKLKEAQQDLSAEVMAAWKEGHAADCCQNHFQSSKSMESEAAKIMWARSIAKHRFRYVEMLSDGDSSAYQAVCNANPYPDYLHNIQKLDCLNHAHKRMGTALRKLAETGRLGGRGVGRLTKNKCDSLQNFYRGAIMDNLPNVDKMKAAIWSTLWHSMSTDEQPRHMQCPTGPDSRCFYQKALARGEDPPSHKDHPASTYLTTQVAHQMIPVYRRMADDNLMKRLVHGGTQNANECLNGMIWSRCPKTSFMGRRRVEGSVARAVSVFNEGATELLTVMDKLYVDISLTSLQFLAKKDEGRMSAGDAAAAQDARRRRKEYATLRRLNNREEEARDPDAYQAGGH